MRLRSALRHLKLHHSDCYSCKLEQLLVQAMIEGRGYVIPVGTQEAIFLSRGRG
jgi:hypothetical protein